MSEQPQRQMQQTMPENDAGWHRVKAGPHLHIMFHPNRQLLGREPDGIERPSIVVAVTGEREQALRFDPFSMGSRLSHPRRACVTGKFCCGSRRGRRRSMSPWRFSKSPCVFVGSSPRPTKTMSRRSWMTPTWSCHPPDPAPLRLRTAYDRRLRAANPWQGRRQPIAGAAQLRAPLPLTSGSTRRLLRLCQAAGARGHRRNETIVTVGSPFSRGGRSRTAEPRDFCTAISNLVEAVRDGAS